MSKTINIIRDSFFQLLQNNREILHKVNDVYCIAPINPSIPYIRLYINNIKELERYLKNNHKLSLKVNLICNIYTFDENDLYVITETIIKLFQNHNLNVENVENFKVIQNYCNISQVKNNNVLLATLNFTIICRIKNEIQY